MEVENKEAVREGRGKERGKEGRGKERGKEERGKEEIQRQRCGVEWCRWSGIVYCNMV